MNIFKVALPIILASLLVLFAYNVFGDSSELSGFYSGDTTPATCGFYYGECENSSNTTFEYNVTCSGTFTNETFTKLVSGLQSSTLYSYTSWTDNGTFNYNSTRKFILTEPSGPPTSFVVDDYGPTYVNFSWSNVTDWSDPCDCNKIVQHTNIRYSAVSYPTTPTSGTSGYFADAESCSITDLDPDTTYYFSAWTYTHLNGSWAFANASSYDWHYNSTAFSTLKASTQGGLYNITVRYENRTYGLVNLSEFFYQYICGGETDINQYDDFTTGDLVNVTLDGSSLVLDSVPDGNYTYNGSRVSPIYSLEGIAEGNGVIYWSENLESGTEIKIYYNLSTDGGVTWGGWQQATNGGNVIGIYEGTILTDNKIKFRQNLSTTDNTSTPELINMYLHVERDCMEMHVNGPHKLIIHHYGGNLLDYYGKVSYIIFEDGNITYDNLINVSANESINGSFNFTTNRTVSFVEFCWNNSDERVYKCNRIVVPEAGQRNITFYIRTDLPIFGEGTGLKNDSIVRYTYSFVDETTNFRYPNKPMATIYTFDDDENKMVIHSEYFDDSELIHPWLVYDKDYIIGVSCAVQEYERLGFAPASDNTAPEVRIPFAFDMNYGFYDLISLDLGWNDVGFYVDYDDTTFSTVSVTFSVYGHNNKTLIYTDTQYNNHYNFTYVCSTTTDYIWQINCTLDDLANDYDGTYSSGRAPIIVGMAPITDIDSLDSIMIIILGESPLYDIDDPDIEIPWTYIGTFAVAFIFLVTLGRLNSMIGVIGAGLVLVFAGGAIAGFDNLIGGASVMVIGFFLIAVAIIGSLGGVER